MTDDPHDSADDRAGSAIGRLGGRVPSTSGWLAAASVRRTAQVRRRQRALGGGVALLLVAAGALGVATGVTPGPSTAYARDAHVRIGERVDGAVQLVAADVPPAGSDPSATAPVVAAERRLTVRLLRQLPAGRNGSVSPLSLMLALGMLQDAARGTTRDEIVAALQAPGIAATTLDAGLAGLTRAMTKAAAGDGITLQSANSLWAQRDFPVKKQFLAALAHFYRTGVWLTDFTTPAARNAINRWTSDHTHGKIRKLFDQLDPATVLVLANAVYFHADWATPFDKTGTSTGTFTTAGGGDVRARFMTREEDFRTTVTDDYQAVELPYRGGHFAALAVMPRHGSLDDFVSGLDAGELARVTRMTARSAVELPRFTTRSTLDLRPVLQRLGMKTAFSDGADFSGLSHEDTAVDQVTQRVYLGVGEKGTTAAAVTGASVRLARVARTAPLRFDRPFLFLVRDTTTGAVLFASRITDPSEK